MALADEARKKRSDDAISPAPGATKPDSYGDAAAASANPGVAQLPAPGLLAQQPATAPKPNFFPGNSPDAGAAIYDGAGFGKSQRAQPPQQVTPPQQATPSREELISQIPGSGLRAPAPDGSQADAWNTELGRNVRNTAMAVPGVAGVGGVAATGGLISRGIRALGLGARVAGAATGIDAAQNGAQQQLAKPGYGPASTDFAGPPAPAAGQPSTAGAQPDEIAGPPTEIRRSIGGGIERVDRVGHSPLFTDNKDPQMAGFMNRPAGGPTKEVNDIMQRMSDKSRDEALGRFQKEANAAQYAREVRQAQAINAAGGENARNVRNQMDQEKYLRDLAVKASSTTAHVGERLISLKAYNEARTADAAARLGSDAGSVARTQAEASRYGYDTGAESSRYRADQENAQFAQTQGVALSQLAMQQQAAGYQNRAAAQSEQLRNVLLDPQATPEQRNMAQRSLSALAGKTAADRMQTVNLPDTTTEMGGVVRGGQALVRTLEDGTVEQVPIGGAQGTAANPMPTDKSQRKKDVTYTLPDGRRVMWDGTGAVPVK